MESLMPTSPLATMVPIIKILVIMLTSMVSAPIGILSLKILSSNEDFPDTTYSTSAHTSHWV